MIKTIVLVFAFLAHIPLILAGQHEDKTEAILDVVTHIKPLKNLIRDYAGTVYHLCQTIDNDDVIHSIACSPDCSTFAAGTDTKNIIIWHAMQGKLKQKRTISAKDYYQAVTYSPDGKYLACVRSFAPNNHFKAVKIWDTDQHKLVRTLSLDEHLGYSLAYSPDSALLAVGSLYSIYLFETTHYRKIAKIRAHDNWVYTLCFSPDGAYFASGSENEPAKMWSTKDFKLAQTLSSGSNSSTRALAFSPTGSHLAMGTNSKNGIIEIWRTDTCQLINSISAHGSEIRALTFSPDGNHLASAGYDKTIKIWHAQNHTLVQCLTDHTDTVIGLQYFSNGQYLVSGSYDFTIRLWHAPTKI